MERSSGLGQLMKLAAGNLFCNKTLHKSEMSFKGTIAMGNKILCLCASLRQGGFFLWAFFFFFLFLFCLLILLSFKWFYRNPEYT